MTISIGQVYRRIPPKDSIHFPEKSWKVKAIGFLEDKVKYETIEFNGSPREEGDVAYMMEKFFLELYELVP